MKRISIEKNLWGNPKKSRENIYWWFKSRKRNYFLSNIGSWITKMLKINERELRKRKEIQKMLQIIIKL